MREELLTRKQAGEESRLLRVEPPQVPDFLLLGQPIGVTDNTGQQNPGPAKPA
jgi:hypothetical protein